MSECRVVGFVTKQSANPVGKGGFEEWLPDVIFVITARLQQITLAIRSSIQ